MLIVLCALVLALSGCVFALACLLDRQEARLVKLEAESQRRQQLTEDAALQPLGWVYDENDQVDLYTECKNSRY